MILVSLGPLALGLMAEAAASAAPMPVARTIAASAPQAGWRPSATSPGRSIPATAADRAALVQAYVSARLLPLGAVAGIRPGSLHLALAPATGADWAIADFTPAPTAGARVQAGFQDGASIGVFTQTAGRPWRLVQAAGRPQRCGRAVPAAIRTAWHLSTPADCLVTVSSARRSAARALSKAGSSRTVGQLIADIALSQVGVSDTPVVTNFAGVNCDPYSTLVGASSPNADGCGFDQRLRVENENEAWCSDFAKWVWQQAGITADTNVINAGAKSFHAWGLDQGESMPADSGTPAAGDAVVFFPPGPITATSYADHVGIVSGVNPDGRFDLVDGDFVGASNISVQYSSDVSLTPWASQLWGHGEQWLLVTPPITHQRPVPSAGMTGARVAVAGTTAGLTAWASARGGSVAQYRWTFGDGSAAIAGGPEASHAFANAGVYPVTMTATSSFGTAATRTWNVDVVAASSAVASTPSTALWYSATPVNQLLFLATDTGGLAAESSGATGWVRQAIPGLAAAGSGLTALNYPDATGSMKPHVYFRAPGGSLAETYQRGGVWATQRLAGQPASGSAIVATTTAPRRTGDGSVAGGGPAVFYFTAAGQLTESYEPGTTWATSTLPGPPASGLGSLALADMTAGGQAQRGQAGGGQAGERLYYLARHDTLMVTSSASRGWRSTEIRSGFGVAAGSPLSAVTTGPDGDEQRVFFIDGRGRLADAVSGQPVGRWAVRELPGTPAPVTSPAPALSLAATNHLLPSGVLSQEVFYLTASGRPAVTFWNGREWQAAPLPGLATAILDADGYPAASQPEQLFLADGPALQLDASDTAGRAWTATVLPGAAATGMPARRA